MKAVSSEYSPNFFDREIEGTAVQTAMIGQTVLGETTKLKPECDARSAIVTSSPEMLRIIGVARLVADADVPVLILGESGVGKDVIAKFIHDQSNRFGNPFVRVNCAALPHDLLESELFGYEKGAFTGAIHDRSGKFEQANKGTLFLDEIAEMTPHLQAKLLHVLQDGEFSRLGARGSKRVDVRILAATNRKLQEAVLKGEFRTDLYFRLNVIQLHIPALRHRPGDIALLANHFLEKYRARYGSSRRTVHKDLMERFTKCQWPGNVRQLENVVKRYLILNAIEVGSDEMVTVDATDTTHTFDLKSVGRRAAEQAERDVVLRVLDETEWNRKECAKRLHISYKALRNRLKKWDVSRHTPFDQFPDLPKAIDQVY